MNVKKKSWIQQIMVQLIFIHITPYCAIHVFEFVQKYSKMFLIILEYFSMLQKMVQFTMMQKHLAGFIFGICVIFMILNPFLGYFMLGDPKTTPKVMLIIIYYPFPNVKFENG